MAKLMSGVTVIAIIISLVTMASATAGIATFYESNVPSTCYGNTTEGVMIAASNDAIFQNGAGCGKVFKVTCTGPTNPVPHPCTGKSVTVKIVDHCPGCPSTLDLSMEAFTSIANPIAAVIKIDYVPA